MSLEGRKKSAQAVLAAYKAAAAANPDGKAYLSPAQCDSLSSLAIIMGNNGLAESIDQLKTDNDTAMNTGDVVMFGDVDAAIEVYAAEPAPAPAEPPAAPPA